MVRLAPVSRPLNMDSKVKREPGEARWKPSGTRIPAETTGYIVFNETFAPGWHAWVEGFPQPISWAHGFFMAVTAGNEASQAVFRYEPASFRLGLFLSLLYLPLILSLGGGKHGG